MSAAGIALVALGGTLQDILLRVPNRGIAGIVLPSVVVQEQAEDELTITEHPVEIGANITDHAFKQPARLSVTYGWSQSGGNAIGLPTIGLGFLSPTPSDVYKMLRDLQATCVPFDVVTGKRKYTNMLLRRISQVNDAESESCLLVDVDMQEVIIVDTSPQAGTTSTGSLQSLSNPAQNGPTTNLGVKLPVDVTSSYAPTDVASMAAQVP